MEDNANLPPPHPTPPASRYSTFGTRFGVNANTAAATTTGGGGSPPTNNGGKQPPQAVNNNYPASILKKRGEEAVSAGRFEARNEEVIRRVAEMQQILKVGAVGSKGFT